MASMRAPHPTTYSGFIRAIRVEPGHAAKEALKSELADHFLRAHPPASASAPPHRLSEPMRSHPDDGFEHGARHPGMMASYVNARHAVAPAVPHGVRELGPEHVFLDRHATPIGFSFVIIEGKKFHLPLGAVWTGHEITAPSGQRHVVYATDGGYKARAVGTHSTHH